MKELQFPNNSTLLQLYARAAAPCRDYYGLIITETYISLHIWKITHGPHVTPKQKVSSLEDFKDDKFLQEEIKNVFGVDVNQYIFDLAYDRRKLDNVPQKVLIHIMKYLNTNDVLRLSRSSKIFYELCNAEMIWLLILSKILRRRPSAEEKRLSIECGWKETLKRRMIVIKKPIVVKKKSPLVKSTNSMTSKLSTSLKSKTSILITSTTPVIPVKSSNKPLLTNKKPVKAK